MISSRNHDSTKNENNLQLAPMSRATHNLQNDDQNGNGTLHQPSCATNVTESLESRRPPVATLPAVPPPLPATSATSFVAEYSPSDDGGDNVPVPPAQVTALYQQMEEDIKRSIDDHVWTDDDDVPPHPGQITKAHREDHGDATNDKKLHLIEEDSDE